ncbi:hypothetical protein A1OO_03260 [Enterovibrio norvegicus FF-33]|uniref:hypothetical protein n=1 Tax=Enterovibrio norvegicus TaxID=188144 RepID=UPI000365AFF2|nr:hypothetical protein [Enterovibrio norvegicus]OEE69813.1 hypothetical protein A1OO_03260 [Enterovibrio norvegicus FF-33]OEE85721.1 hypothetical protein A1OQ_17810 [Enterovibrio norvegicus FF-162]
MFKYYPLIFISLISTSAMANNTVSVLDSLKSQPLTSYEAGKNLLTSFAMLMNTTKSFKKDDDMPYFEVLDESDQLGVEITLQQRTKKISNDFCNTRLSELNKFTAHANLPKILWPNLSEDEALDIKNELFIKLTLVAEENKNFKMSCSKRLNEL